MLTQSKLIMLLALLAGLMNYTFAQSFFEVPNQTEKERITFKIWHRDGSDGEIDIDGREVAPTIKSNIGEFSEGLAPIRVGNKFGYVNEKLEIVIKPRWEARGMFTDVVGPFRDGLARVIEGFMTYASDDYDVYLAKCGYINTKGEYVIEPKFRQGCGDFSNGVALIGVDDRGDEYTKGLGIYGYIDRKGSWAIKPQFYEASNFLDGYALVQRDAFPKDEYARTSDGTATRKNFERASLSLIDTSGKPAVGVKDCRWRYTFTEGLAYAHNAKNERVFLNGKCEEQFTLPADLKTETGYPRFQEGLLLAYRIVDGKKLYGYLDTKGKVAIDFQFTSAAEFSDGLAGVSLTSKMLLASGQSETKAIACYIDRTGHVVIGNTRGTTPFKNGLALHHLYTWTISERPAARNIKGYMNKQGKYVWLSPRAEQYLDKKWIRDNYVGPDESLRK